MLARLLARPLLVPLGRLGRDARSSGTDDLTNLPNRRAFTEAACRPSWFGPAGRAGRSQSCSSTSTISRRSTTPTATRQATASFPASPTSFASTSARSTSRPGSGGDEFAVLLPETDLAGAREAAERFVAALAGSEFDDGRDHLGRITASAGIAAAADLELEALLETADRALYRAKKDGKNRVQVEEL